MKKLLNRDNIATGVIATLVSELLCGALVWVVLLIAGVTVGEGMRWFMAAFVPPLLLLRYYAKKQSYPTTLKAVITTFFVTLVAFMWLYLH